MRGSSARNLSMFKQLIGDEFYKNLTLGTTCWSLVDFSTALDRESELKTDSKFWKVLISKGARVECIPDDAAKAKDLVYEIASHDAIPTQTQRDVVDLGISFSNLTVTKTVNYELEQLRSQQRAEIGRLEAARRQRLRWEEEARQRDLELIRQSNARIEAYEIRQNFCQGKWPTGICDNSGCNSKLKRWTVTWRKFPEKHCD